MDTASRPSRSAIATAAAVISSRECPAGRPVAARSGRIQITPASPPAAIRAPVISFANTVPKLLAYFANAVCEDGWGDHAGIRFRAGAGLGRGVGGVGSGWG